MSRLFQPWQLLVTILAGWMTEQQQLIEYLRTENRVLKELHGKKRLRLTDDQRRSTGISRSGSAIAIEHFVWCILGITREDSSLFGYHDPVTPATPPHHHFLP